MPQEINNLKIFNVKNAGDSILIGAQTARNAVESIAERDCASIHFGIKELSPTEFLINFHNFKGKYIAEEINATRE